MRAALACMKQLEYAMIDTKKNMFNIIEDL